MEEGGYLSLQDEPYRGGDVLAYYRDLKNQQIRDIIHEMFGKNFQVSFDDAGITVHGAHGFAEFDLTHDSVLRVFLGNMSHGDFVMTSVNDHEFKSRTFDLARRINRFFGQDVFKNYKTLQVYSGESEMSFARDGVSQLFEPTVVGMTKHHALPRIIDPLKKDSRTIFDLVMDCFGSAWRNFETSLNHSPLVYELAEPVVISSWSDAWRMLQALDPQLFAITSHPQWDEFRDLFEPVKEPPKPVIKKITFDQLSDEQKRQFRIVNKIFVAVDCVIHAPRNNRVIVESLRGRIVEVLFNDVTRNSSLAENERLGFHVGAWKDNEIDSMDETLQSFFVSTLTASMDSLKDDPDLANIKMVRVQSGYQEEIFTRSVGAYFHRMISIKHSISLLPSKPTHVFFNSDKESQISFIRDFLDRDAKIYLADENEKQVRFLVDDPKREKIWSFTFDKKEAKIVIVVGKKEGKQVEQISDDKHFVIKALVAVSLLHVKASPLLAKNPLVIVQFANRELVYKKQADSPSYQFKSIEKTKETWAPLRVPSEENPTDRLYGTITIPPKPLVKMNVSFGEVMACFHSIELPETVRDIFDVIKKAFTVSPPVKEAPTPKVKLTLGIPQLPKLQITFKKPVLSLTESDEGLSPNSPDTILLGGVLTGVVKPVGILVP